MSRSFRRTRFLFVFFVSSIFHEKNHPPKKLWNERFPLCPLLMKICRSINMKQGLFLLFFLPFSPLLFFSLSLPFYVSLWRCFTRHEKKKKELKRILENLLFKGEETVKSDVFEILKSVCFSVVMRISFFFLLSMDFVSPCFLYIVFFLFFRN